MLGTAAVMTASSLMGPLMGTSHASVKGRRNTVIAGAAVTAYGLLKGNKTIAIAGGLGTLYAYKRYRDAKRSHRVQTIGQVFGNTPVYDSRHHRYSRYSRFYPSRTYYNWRGQVSG
jgi:hypothetical protein